jgi:hypothetical protein
MIETDDLEPILNRVHEWTRAADAKVHILTAIEAGVVVLLIPALVAWIQDPLNAFENKFKLLLGFGFLIVALVKSLQALFPRTSDQWWRRLWREIKREHPDRLQKSITYFGDIASMTLAEYRARLNNITSADLREDLIGQIHLSAGIAGRKHHNIKVAILLFCVGLTIIGWTYVRWKAA